MSLGYVLLIAGLFAIAIYLLLRDDLLDHIFGLIVLGHAANLLVFGSGRLERGEAPVLARGHEVADPLPQALVLTAIVIGFGIVAYAIVLVIQLQEVRKHADHTDHAHEEPDA